MITDIKFISKQKGHDKFQNLIATWQYSSSIACKLIHLLKTKLIIIEIVIPHPDAVEHKMHAAKKSIRKHQDSRKKMHQFLQNTPIL